MLRSLSHDLPVKITGWTRVLDFFFQINLPRKSTPHPCLENEYSKIYLEKNDKIFERKKNRAAGTKGKIDRNCVN